MHKVELERLLEQAVADALGVRLPRRRAVSQRPRHVARSPKRVSQAARELHPA
ncbi:MAG: hypothetical protein ACO1OG_08365 [Devosia sp.]